MDNQHEHTMVVSGVGTAQLTPDCAEVEASLEVSDADPARAYTELAVVVDRVVAALAEHGVTDADRQTRTVSLSPQYSYEGPIATISGYTATHALRLRIARLAATTEVLDALVGSARPAPTRSTREWS